MTGLREKAALGLVGALGRMAEALANKKLDQSADALKKAERRGVASPAGIRAQERAAKLADDAIKLHRAAQQARDFLGS